MKMKSTIAAYIFLVQTEAQNTVKDGRKQNYVRLAISELTTPFYRMENWHGQRRLRKEDAGK